MNRNRNLLKLAVPVGVIGIILLLVVPIPAELLDVLIIINILLALVILLTTMFVRKPLDFSVFPSLLLVATLFRLGLNVASTRLVLGEGYAGQVIEAFGHVAVGGSLIIGAVIFLILVVIQFVVVTKGAERVAEVGARFTLDAMPGKQMAIDADLNAGLITDTQARERRAEVSAEADFYGAMDGASKFVKGDAIAGLIIIIINLIGGIAIGMIQRSMSAGEAVSTYSLLTIGDGLVTQIPALLMAVSTGMIVTRSNAEADMGTTAGAQLGQSRNALMIAGAAAIVMALIPGMPKLYFIAIGALLIFISWKIKGKETTDQAEKDSAQAALDAPATSETTEDLIEQMRVHALEIMLAPDLVDIVTGGSDDLLARVRALRRKIAMELGIVVPPVRTRDSVDLPMSTYVIRIAGVEAGRGDAPAGKILALGDYLEGLPGTATVEPVFGLAGKWVPAEMQHAAEMSGATVIDRVSVLVTHLSAVITANAARLLTREDVRVLTEGVKLVNPSAVEELIPNVMSLAEVQRVLQGLLAEQIPINDLPRIYESLLLRAKVSADPEGLIETARTALGPALAAQYIADGVLRVIMIDPALEQSMLEALRPSEQGSQILLDPARVDAVLASLKAAVAGAENAGFNAVLVCAPALRPAIRRLVSAQTGGLPVLSYQEATAGNVGIETVGVVRGSETISA
ncbi:flagellar biosynthesis protein FlhA [Arthrobacter sp. zg-Y1171]|uniref:flagellar biosynthesis protein FlhA n=1 Tax=unclassified Arthrobacter TaxID=235627 RepID=UPI00210641E0|nr:flagellar biosynthesis protein FlhA [Arthrobacter sp. zg-Y1171]MCQ1948286.1 flagellar biosynthesis protein FlhA [Arthrobacter sp. zg-Y1116]MCQ1988058.1 flagellar biosynthesis protein FlhA [Arthrobacter sp. zg-Y844]MCQ1996663.1 flagellar biosynthesis protein FlhA [Arthrobacter sp. zg-Y1171]UWX82260.1 flagellar biosynthesis protein FlhA [Arthrobacter sp. zg-Y1171]